MKKIINKSLMCIMAVCFLGTVSIVYAEQVCDTGGVSWQQDKEAKFEKISQELGLNEEQQTALKAHFEAKKEKMKEIRTSLKETRKALKEELKKYNSDKETIEKITLQMKELEAKQIDYRVENFLEMKQILTEEQFNKFGTHIEKMRKHKKHKGKRSEKSPQE